MDSQASTLEWMLFTPSPVSEIVQAHLTAFDALALRAVCRSWRQYFIPGSSKWPFQEDIRTQWYPPLKCLALTRRSTSRERKLSIEVGPRGVKGGPGHRSPEFYLIPYKFDIVRFARMFNPNYLEIITRIYLDGMSFPFKLPSQSDTDLGGVMGCSNLQEFSVRWCSGIFVQHLAAFFLNIDLAVPFRFPNRRVKPQNLKKLMFWGITGSSAEPWQPEWDLLMTRYETDVRWCTGQPHYPPAEKVRRLREAKDLTCMLCAKVKESRCGKCDLENICDRCLEYICDDCLILGLPQPFDFMGHLNTFGMEPPEIGQRRSRFNNSVPEIEQSIVERDGQDEGKHKGEHDHSRTVEIDDILPTTVSNMLQYKCIRGSCIWRRANHESRSPGNQFQSHSRAGGFHYFHPKCVSLAFVPGDLNEKRFCTGCPQYLCDVKDVVCRHCGAGSVCCRAPFEYCPTCQMKVCDRCGNCDAEPGEHVHFNEMEWDS